ncbi:MAG: ATP synthase F1 subunit delta [Candidatus Kapabacteria bacterium]|nr:ATP synthase F1 subunit delta [Candidatus Kapabacteria bacterium]
MTEYKVSFRYARAVLELAEEQNLSDTIYQDLDFVRRTLKSSFQLKLFTINPIIQEWRKVKAYKAIFENKISSLTLNFLVFIIRKRRSNLIESIAEQFILQYNELKNRKFVEIQSAVELNEDLKTKAVAKINTLINKTIIPDFKINPHLKGGILIKVDDWVYDGSIKNQLEHLHKQLIEGKQI